MLFSIIIPVYNVEQYLKECVDSVLKQTYNDYEIILVNDGSKDGSAQICEQYAKNYKEINVVHKENGGLSSARNEGLKRAKGEYIVFIDSDDYIKERNFLEHLKEKTNNSPDLILYKFEKYYENRRTFSKCTFSLPQNVEEMKLCEIIEELVKTDAFYCSAWSKCVRRDLLTTNDIWFQEGIIAEDQEWYYHVLLNTKTINTLDESVIIYRQRDNSITSSWKMKNLTDCLYVVRKWRDKLNEAELDMDYKNALLNSVAKLYCNLLIAYTRFTEPQKKRYYCDLKEMSDLMNYHINPRVNTLYKFYKVGGFSLMMVGLKIVCKVK